MQKKRESDLEKNNENFEEDGNNITNSDETSKDNIGKNEHSNDTSVDKNGIYIFA